ncbi:MAG: response regulator [Proteobacteria bacterium]|nr:response regulator [Pseudomonadota bacterium]MBU1640576.1 response regulator [Pseudomonadota bacterium]
MSTRTKVIAAVMLVILTICAIFLALFSRQNRQNLQSIISSKAESASIVARAIIDQAGRQYSLRMKSFVSYKAFDSKEQLIKAFADRDRQRLQTLSTPFFDLLQKENPYFASLGWILPDNTAFLRVHDPENFGQDVSTMRPDVAAVNKDRRPRSGFTTGYVGLHYRVVQPVFYQGAYLGAVQIGIKGEILIDSLSRELKTPVGVAIPNSEYATILPKHQKGLNGPTHTIVASMPTFFDPLLREIDWTKAQHTLKDDAKTYILFNVNSLANFQGKELGILFVILDITPEVHKGRALLASAFALSAILLALSFVILYFSYGSLVQKIVDLNLSLAHNNRELEKSVEERTQILLTEIEERKITEAKLQKAEKMEAIGLMAGGVAHDLNNILSGVVSYPELLLMQLPEDSELRRPLTTIHESGLRAAAVVADLLTVARSAAKVREVAQINTIVHDYLVSPEGKKLLALYPDVKIKTQLASKLANIFCSPVHVRKCLMNLVINAAEALDTSCGTILIISENRKLSASTDKKDLPPGDYVALTVRDDGPGIPDADLEHIFEPFYTKKKMGRSGTGIGLAVVWSAMQDHGGRVSVESNGQGTTFTLLFPATTAKEHEAAHHVTIQELQGKGEQILVVDDEPYQRDIASQLLNILGYKVSTASSGEEALRSMTDNKADLILLDMLMDPGINGRQTYEEIIKKHPGQKAVIASGFSESDEVKKAISLGACAFIKKPYTLEELGLAIKKALQA